MHDRLVTTRTLRREGLEEGEIDPFPGKTMPTVTVVECDYPDLYKRFTSLGPLMAKLGNGGKAWSWKYRA